MRESVYEQVMRAQRAIEERMTQLESAGGEEGERCELCGLSWGAASPGCLTAEAHYG